MKNKNDNKHPLDEDCIIKSDDENLLNGIWPNSIAFWMTGIYVAIFIVRPWEYLFPWLGTIRFEKIYAILMITAVFFSKKAKNKITLQSFSVVTFFIALITSGIFAYNPELSWNPIYKYLTLVIFYFILLFVIKSPYELVFIVTCYIMTMNVYLAKSQWEFFLHGRHYYRMGVRRLIGIENTFSGPNWLALSIIMSLPFLLFLWSVRKSFYRTWSKFWQKSFRYSLITYLILALSSIILTNSRGGMLGLVLYTFIIVSKMGKLGKKIKYLSLSIILLAIIWTVMPEENKARLRTVWDPESGPQSAQTSAEGRLEGLIAGVEIFKRYPFLGVGVGNYLTYRVKHIDGVALQPHNLTGQVLGETGLIGTTAFIIMLLAAIKNYKKTITIANLYSVERLDVLKRLSLACQDSIIILLYEGLINHNYLRFNWIWLAAFGTISLKFAEEIAKKEKLRMDMTKN